MSVYGQSVFSQTALNDDPEKHRGKSSGVLCLQYCTSLSFPLLLLCVVSISRQMDRVSACGLAHSALHYGEQERSELQSYAAIAVS